MDRLLLYLSTLLTRWFRCVFVFFHCFSSLPFVFFCYYYLWFLFCGCRFVSSSVRPCCLWVWNTFNVNVNPIKKGISQIHIPLNLICGDEKCSVTSSSSSSSSSRLCVSSVQYWFYKFDKLQRKMHINWLCFDIKIECIISWLRLEIAHSSTFSAAALELQLWSK